MNTGNTVVIVSGSRLRRVSDDGKSLLDQGMHEGALIDYDKEAKVVGVVESKDQSKVAYVLEVKHNNVKLMGWCYGYEITAGK